jgi:hypothetical protein
MATRRHRGEASASTRRSVPVAAVDQRDLFAAVISDGRPLLLMVIGALAFAGGFAVFLAIVREFLPPDIHFHGMTAQDLCRVDDCRIVDFMVHDRAAWGGTMLGCAVLWAWLVVFPLSAKEPWAWWTLAVSGTVGFASFLGYLAYGYLDTWHGFGILLMLVPFVVGMARVAATLPALSLRDVLQHRPDVSGDLRRDAGWALLFGGALATAVGGLTILWVGLTRTFVAEDLAFIGTSAAQLRTISDRLVPLIAHDRVGFGGGVATMGITTAMCAWFAPLSRHFFQAVATAGVISVACAIGVHFVVGYTDAKHLAPAIVAAADLALALLLLAPSLSADVPPES